MNRPDLLKCLKQYSHEELKGGFKYTFLEDDTYSDKIINAQTALENYNKKGISPLTKWVTHMFTYTGQRKEM